jgi:nitroreductase
MNASDLTSALNWRYATKQFDSTRKLSTEIIDALAEALRLSPSSFGLQPWKFFLVENPELRAQLRAQSWHQAQVTDASHLFVLAVKKAITPADAQEWIEQLSTIQNTPLESLAMLHKMILGFLGAMDEAQMLAWTTRQSYIALGQLMTSAAVLGIDACPLEGIIPAEYDKLLSLTDSDYTTVVACAVGHRHADDKYATSPKARKSEGQVLVRL